MDFKVTGTADGITACQMDIKVKGLSYEILVNALKQARDGRLHILEKLTDTIACSCGRCETTFSKNGDTYVFLMNLLVPLSDLVEK